MLEEKWVTLSVNWSHMEKLNLPIFYELGAKLNPLTEMNAKPDNRVDMVIASLNVERGVRFLLDSFSTLTVCRTVGEELLAKIDDAAKWLIKAETNEVNKPDPSVNMKFRQLISKAKEFETVLSAELQTLATYHVTQKGIYSTPDLIDHAENILPVPVLEKVGVGVVEEIRQSGRCLAFDCATASAFHILRAAEVVMHEYYISVCKPKNQKRLRSWGAYITELKKSNDPNVPEVVAMIQQIKDRHRNLIMHPEVVLSPDEAFTLFEIAQAAIIAMADKLPVVKKK